jgi:hypothetical protein
MFLHLQGQHNLLKDERDGLANNLADTKASHAALESDKAGLLNDKVCNLRRSSVEHF